MIQYTIAVEGMACSMCEAHINDAVRKALTETELDEDALRAAISATGYEVGEIRKEPWAKKGLFGR